MSSPITSHPTQQRTIATFERHADAEAAVDRLADARFPVERTTIVASGLRFVQQPTGRRSFRSDTIRGAGAGALTGLVVGLFLSLFSVAEPVESAFWLGFWGVVLGGLFGALLAAAGHLAERGRRDFTSVQALQADRFELRVDDELADRAAATLGRRR